MTNPAYIDDFPDYLLIAEDGWSFKGLCSNNRVLYNIEKYNSTLPVYSEIGYPSHIEGICGLMEDALDQGEKVLLAVVEGLDEDDFVLPHQNVNNCRDWYAYEGYTLYHTLVTGKPFWHCTHPPIYDMSARRMLPLHYPMSTPPHRDYLCGISGKESQCSHSSCRQPQHNNTCYGQCGPYDGVLYTFPGKYGCFGSSQ